MIIFVPESENRQDENLLFTVKFKNRARNKQQKVVMGNAFNNFEIPQILIEIATAKTLMQIITMKQEAVSKMVFILRLIDEVTSNSANHMT